MRREADATVVGLGEVGGLAEDADTENVYGLGSIVGDGDGLRGAGGSDLLIAEVDAGRRDGENGAMSSKRDGMRATRCVVNDCKGSGAQAAGARLEHYGEAATRSRRDRGRAGVSLSEFKRVGAGDSGAGHNQVDGA